MCVERRLRSGKDRKGVDVEASQIVDPESCVILRRKGGIGVGEKWAHDMQMTAGEGRGKQEIYKEVFHQSVSAHRRCCRVLSH